MSRQHSRRTLFLLQGGSAKLPSTLASMALEGPVIVAAPCLVRLAVARLLIPGAEGIWANPTSSASMRDVRAVVARAGGFKRFVLVGERRTQSADFGHWSSILTLLPELQRQEGAEVVLFLPDGQAALSVRSFFDRVQQKLSKARVKVSLNSLEDA
jgi:hypothetical protein